MGLFLIVIGVLLALTIGLFFAPGVGLIALVPLAVAVIVAGWFLLAFVGGDSPSRAVRRTQKPELLGPGGPDDPDRAR
jgi:multisubunit Na+/H+ antiporter MnhB subunit